MTICSKCGSEREITEIFCGKCGTQINEVIKENVSKNHNNRNHLEVKVIPFVANVTDVNPSASAASQLESLINSTVQDGWKFDSISTMQTFIKATGCGANNKPDIVRSIQLLIFKK